MDVGTQLKLEIEKSVFSGDGLAHVDGQVVFVPGALPGELLIAEVTAVKKNFLRAKIVRFGNTSPHRIEPECPAAARCPGCVYWHTTYEYETALKQQQLRDFLAAENIVPELPLEEPLAVPPDKNYRNKIMLHVNKEGAETMIGYVGADNQTVTPIDRCLLAREEINELLATKLADHGFRHTVHNRMDLTFRYTAHDGAIFWRNAPAKNSTWLREDTKWGQLSVPPDGFFQVNINGANALGGELEKVLAENPVSRFIDLYCGVGLFSCVAAAHGIREIYGAELSEPAIACAKYNLKGRDCAGAEMLATDAVQALPGFLADAPADTLIVVDPPRNGMALKMAQALAGLPHGALVYISCHPATWARDANRLVKGGWKLRRVRLINQFARTAHFELFSYFVK